MVMGDPCSPLTNFYSVLGLPKSASLPDICKAYKSLVMKWHPDKNSSNKAEAEAKFKVINEAYRALSTKKREENSRFGNEARMPTKMEDIFQNRSASESFFSRSGSRRSNTPTPPSPRSLSRNASRRSTTPTPADFYASFSKSTDGGAANPPTFSPSLSKNTSRRSTNPIIFSNSNARKKPQPIEKKLQCTLEELCRGCVKKIKITRDAISDAGLIVKEEEILKIKVKPGWKKGTKITFEGKGDERPGTLPADIIFVIDEKRHPLFKREGDDLELGVEISLVDALTGCTITVPLLGGEEMTLSLMDDIIYPGYEKIVPGQGMPKPKDQGRRGDLRLKFLVEFPLELSDEQRFDAVSVLTDCC